MEGNRVGTDIPTFVNTKKAGGHVDGYVIRTTDLPEGNAFPTKSNFVKMVFRVEHPQKTSGTSEFKFIINRDQHCMVKVFALEFT